MSAPRSSIPRDERRRLILGLTPVTLLMGAFLLMPLALVVIMSLLKPGPYGGYIWQFDLGAWQKLLISKRLDGSVTPNWTFLIVFARSLLLALATSVICVLIGFPVAYFISRQSARVKNILLLLVMFPFWSNLLIRTTSWVVILRDQGLINQLLIKLGLIGQPIQMLYTETAILVGLVYVYIPFMVMPIYTSIERLDFRLIEASHDLFASRAATLRHVIWPLTAPGVVSGAILVFVPSLGAFVTPDLLGGGKKLMLGGMIQAQFTTARNWPYGAALAVVLMALVMISLYLSARVAGRKAQHRSRAKPGADTVGEKLA